MPTIFTHAVVPLGLGLALGRKTISPRLIAAGMFVAIAPDFDTVAFKLGIAYADQFGHRGASHSFVFALAVALFGAMVAPWLRTTRWRAFWWLAFCTASHPLLDALTNGGLGVALLWPWSHERFFAPWRPIAVSSTRCSRPCRKKSCLKRLRRVKGRRAAVVLTARGWR